MRVSVFLLFLFSLAAQADGTNATMWTGSPADPPPLAFKNAPAQAIDYTHNSPAHWQPDGAVDIVALRTHPETLFFKTPKNCPAEYQNAVDLNPLLAKYQSELLQEDNDGAKLTLKNVLALVAPLSSADTLSDCQMSLAKSYLAESLQILLEDSLINFVRDPLVWDSSTAALKNEFWQAIRGGYELQEGEIELMSANDLLYFTSLYLLQQEPVRFLNASLRTELTQEKSDEIWQKLEKDGRHSILGAYECGDQTIYLDPSLPPYDFAATWMHEMDHLFRDLLGPSDFFQKSPEDAIRTDELLASVEASFSQWNVRRTTNLKRMPLWERFLMAFGHGSDEMYSHNQFFFSDDLRFINRSGPVADFYNPNGFEKTVDDPIPKNNINSILDAYFLKQDWTGGDNDDVPLNWNYHSFDFGTHNGEESANKLLQKTDRIISKAYFSEKISTYDPKIYSSNVDPLNKLADEVQSPRHFEKRSDSPMLAQFMDLLSSKFGAASDSCKAFEAAVSQGGLDHYIGVDGSRPGKDGVRPGKDGVRPSLPIRPCIDLHDEL